jgi:hypothetical protein
MIAERFRKLQGYGTCLLLEYALQEQFQIEAERANPSRPILIQTSN